MCGIAGLVSLDGRALDPRALRAMADAMGHRGPDDSGFLAANSGRGGSPVRAVPLCERRFADLAPGVATIDGREGERALADGHWDLLLAHRRLSILDLSAAGHQPMCLAGGRKWLCYNGETYNHLTLRRGLEDRGTRFEGTGDTETLVHLLATHGIGAVERLNGMFAFAWLDLDAGELWLARDRCGIKPLYWRREGSRIAFASEIKPILAATGPAEMDLVALDEYMAFQNVLSDRTLFEGVRVVPPAHVVRISLRDGSVSARRWWDFDFSAEDPRPRAELAEDLADRIHAAVQRQCLSDVPVGSYLSGGMDSGTMVAVASRHLGRINTFTAGFDLSESTAHERNFDERELAERLASICQTEHYEVVMHAGDIGACIGPLVEHLEDLRVGQCYPNWYVAKLASRFNKVVLSGCGGDELFGGYPWRYAAAVGDTHADYVDNYFRWWQRLAPDDIRGSLLVPEVSRRMAEAVRDAGHDPATHAREVFGAVFPAGIRVATQREQVNWSLYFECRTFLHGLLIVEDRLSMAHGLEVRVPLLDNEVIDLAMRIPIHEKIHAVGGLDRLDENEAGDKRAVYERSHPGGKSILREAMSRIVPREFLDARKQGFSAPDESWFRGRAQRFVRESLFDPASPAATVFDRAALERVLALHGSGDRNFRLLIWSLLSIDRLMRRYGLPVGGAARTTVAQGA